MEKGGCRGFLLLALSVILIGCPSNVVTFTTGHRNATLWYHTTPVYETLPADMGHVRLVGGQRPTEGIVEIQINGEWGTVCDDNFDHNAARVVCNQLGYHWSNVTAIQTGPSGYTYLSNTSSTPIWMDNFRCSGHESRLVSCTRYNNFGQHDCGHHEDAGVDCLGYAHVPYSQYSTTPYYWHTTNYWGNTSHNEPLRLVGGSRPTEGRVEIYHNGLWGTVCDDGFDITDAEVVCRQLGYYFSRAPTVQDRAFYGQGSGQIWMDDVHCRGTESNLTDCPFSGFGHHNCGHDEDVGVDCLGYEQGGGSYSTTQRPLTNITHVNGQAALTMTLANTMDKYETKTGAQLKFTCSLNRGLSIILSYKISWVHVSLVDLAHPVSHVLTEQQALTSAAHPDNYEIAFDYTADSTNAGLTVKNVQPNMDGKFICRATSVKNSADVLEKEVKVAVLGDVVDLELDFDGDAVYEESTTPIERDAGRYDISCTASGFSQMAEVHISLDDEQLTDVVLSDVVYSPDLSVQQGARRYMVTASASAVKVRPSNSKVSCHAMATFEGAADISASMPLKIMSCATILLTATPQDVMTGVTPSLTLTCAPGYRDDLSRIFLIQINLLHGNGSKTAVADIDSGQTARVVDGHQRTSVRGFIPYQSYQQSQAYLTVTINSPTVEDCGQWECTLSGLNSHNLMVTETAETIVHVSSLEGLAGELGGLRDELHAAESTINDLKNTIDELQGHKGQGFTAFLISNYTATHGRLPFQREAVDTMGGFSNSVLNPPVDGLYVLTLTVSVNRGHRVTVALRHDGQTLLTLIAKGDNDSEGQASASEVVALQANHPVDVEVVDYSYGSILLASPSTLLSGYLLS